MKYEDHPKSIARRRMLNKSLDSKQCLFLIRSRIINGKQTLVQKLYKQLAISYTKGEDMFQAAHKTVLLNNYQDE